MQEFQHGLTRFSSASSLASVRPTRPGKESSWDQYNDPTIDAGTVPHLSEIKLLKLAQHTGVLQFLLSQAAPCAIVADEHVLKVLHAQQAGRQHARALFHRRY